ncbi:MAG: hypothetical protein Q8N03_16830 [Ignavibacteria bacterium]|nr:hypothetical protein [Ignavibacteria bacterium]
MLSKIPHYVTKYQTKFALENWQIGTTLADSFEIIIIIPAIKEFENIKRLVKSLLLNDNKYFKKTLILFVVNNDVSTDDEIKSDNKKSLEFLSKLAGQDNVSNMMISLENKSDLTISFIDASTNGNELPLKDAGVGLARKIGMDLALNYFSYEKSKPILVCLDADCEVSSNYITEIYEKFNSSSIEAASIRFEHKLEELEDINKAIINYELFLRYYVLGLKYANSPYSFFTIGSSMACTAEVYCKIGGMNKKKAAEDFYFLEKLSKNYPIVNINSCTVFPSSRCSWRVPFGTGQRVNRFLSNVQNEYVLYNPLSFVILKNWLEVFMMDQAVSADDYLNEAIKINPGLAQFLSDQKFEIEWTKIVENSKSAEQLMRQKKYWFDGFRTLKLIHFLRDHSLGLSQMFDALDELFMLMGIQKPINRNSSFPSQDEQKEYLFILREVTN